MQAERNHAATEAVDKHKKALMYISAVARECPLQVPGMLADKAQYQKPLDGLRENEVGVLIQHYKRVIQDRATPAPERHIAELEMLALCVQSMSLPTTKAVSFEHGAGEAFVSLSIDAELFHAVLTKVDQTRTQTSINQARQVYLDSVLKIPELSEVPYSAYDNVLDDDNSPDLQNQRLRTRFTDIAEKILTTEVDDLYKKLGLEQLNVNLSEKVKQLTKVLLAVSSDHPSWFKANQCYHALINAVGNYKKFGHTEVGDAFVAAHIERLQSVRETGNSWQKHSVVTKINALKLKGVVSVAAIPVQDHPWQKTFMGVSAQLSQYEGQFWKAADRVEQCADLRQKIERINAWSGSSPAGHGLSALLSSLNEASYQAAKTDLEKDKETSKSWLRFFKGYRNIDGSDFQKRLRVMSNQVLLNLSDLAMTEPARHTEVMKAQIFHISRLLKLVEAKVSLPGLEKIKEKIDFEHLNLLLGDLKNQTFSDAAKLVQLADFKNKLNAIKKSYFPASGKENALLHFLNGIGEQITRLELIAQTAPQPEAVKTSAAMLESILQQSMPFLGKSNPLLAETAVDLSLRYKEIAGILDGFDVKNAIKECVLVSLVEAEQAVRSVYGAHAKVDFEMHRVDVKASDIKISMKITAEDGQNFNSQLTFSKFKSYAQPLVNVAALQLDTALPSATRSGQGAAVPVPPPAHSPGSAEKPPKNFALAFAAKILKDAAPRARSEVVNSR